jgi:hypothetical protein
VETSEIIPMQVPLSFSSVKFNTLQSLLVKVGGYFNGNLYRFVLDENQKLHLSKESVKENTFSPTILIVARKFYQEEVISFPVDNKLELKKLLALKFQQQPRTQYTICKIEDGKSIINSWHYTAKVPTSAVVLPESLLLTLAANDNQIISLENKSENSCLFAVRSQHGVYSQLQTNNITTAQRFSISVGVAQTESTKVIEQKGVAQQLVLGCQQLSASLLFCFINLPKPESSTKLLKQVFIPVFAVLTVYLSISSAYLLYRDSSLQTQLSEQSQLVSQALNDQQKYDTRVNQYNAFADFLKNKQSRSPIWLVLSEAFSQAQFSNIRLVNNRYILRGKTAKAINLLELLVKHPLVKDAKFDSPTRTRKNQELFTISLAFIDDLGIGSNEVSQ